MFYFTQAGTGVPQEEADDGNNSMKKQARTPTSAVEYMDRPINSSKFVFMADKSIVSYVPKKGKNVVLKSTLHRDGRI